MQNADRTRFETTCPIAVFLRARSLKSHTSVSEFCILNSELQSSERLSKQDVQHPAPFLYAGHQLARVEVEAQIDADRPNGRAVHHAKAGRRTQVGKVEIARLREHVAGVHESCGLQRPHDADAQLAVQHDDAVASGREPGGRNRLFVAQAVERKTTYGGVAAREEALARGEILDDQFSYVPRKSVCKTNAGSEREHDAPRRGQLPIVEALKIRLHEPDLGSQESRRDLAIGD